MAGTSSFDLEVTLADTTTVLGLMLVKPEGWPAGTPVSLSDKLVQSSDKTPLSAGLETYIQESWIRGVGLDYDGAYGVYTRTDGYGCPAGKATGVTFLGTGTSNTPIVAYAEYRGDLYIAQQGLNSAGSYGRVIKLAGGTGAISVEMRIGTAPTVLAGSTAFIRDMLVADDGAGNTVLFVSASDVDGLNGVIYRRDSAGTWTTSGAVFTGGAGRNRMAPVHWTTPDGNSAWRIVSISGPKTFAYTLPGADPMLAASWVDGVAGAGAGSLSEIGTGGQLKEVIAFRRRAYLGATDGVYSINELAESDEITSYLRRMLQPGNGYAVEHLDGFIYIAVGRGLIRIYVGNGDVLDENPLEGQCAPGWNTPAEGAFRGYVTAMCVDQGFLVCAVYEPTIKQSFIFWGIDRRTVNIDAPQPMVWYGPEAYLDADYMVDRMTTSFVTSTGELRLWIAAHSVSGGQVFLNWVSLPIAGSPIQDLAAGGAHRFTTASPGSHINPECYLESLQDTRGNKALTKTQYQVSVGSRGPLSATKKLTLKTRADPALNGSTAYTNQGDITATTANYDLLLNPQTSGNKLQYRIDLTSPDPTAPAILDSLSFLEWRQAPALRQLDFEVEWGDGVGNDTMLSPRDKQLALQTLVNAPRPTTIREWDDTRWTVKFQQILDGDEQMTNGPFGRRSRKRLRAIVLAGPLVT